MVSLHNNRTVTKTLHEHRYENSRRNTHGLYSGAYERRCSGQKARGVYLTMERRVWDLKSNGCNSSQNHSKEKAAQNELSGAASSTKSSIDAGLKNSQKYRNRVACLQSVRQQPSCTDINHTQGNAGLSLHVTGHKAPVSYKTLLYHP